MRCVNYEVRVQLERFDNVRNWPFAEIVTAKRHS